MKTDLKKGTLFCRHSFEMTFLLCVTCVIFMSGATVRLVHNHCEAVVSRQTPAGLDTFSRDMSMLDRPYM